MQTHVTLDMVYDKLKSLQQDVEIVKYAVLPTERVSPKELKDIRRAILEMQQGQKRPLEDVLAEL